MKDVDGAAVYILCADHSYVSAAKVPHSVFTDDFYAPQPIPVYIVHTNMIQELCIVHR